MWETWRSPAARILPAQCVSAQSLSNDKQHHTYTQHKQSQWDMDTNITESIQSQWDMDTKITEQPEKYIQSGHHSKSGLTFLIMWSTTCYCTLHHKNSPLAAQSYTATQTIPVHTLNHTQLHKPSISTPSIIHNYTNYRCPHPQSSIHWLNPSVICLDNHSSTGNSITVKKEFSDTEKKKMRTAYKK